MVLDLVADDRCADHLHGLAQQRHGEVGNADVPRQPLLLKPHHLRQRRAQIHVGRRPVDQVQIHVVRAKLAQAGLHRPAHGVRAQVVPPDLGGDVDIAALHAGGGQRRAHRVLVAVHLRGVDVAIAARQRPLHRIGAVGPPHLQVPRPSFGIRNPPAVMLSMRALLSPVCEKSTRAANPVSVPNARCAPSGAPGQRRDRAAAGAADRQDAARRRCRPAPPARRRSRPPPPPAAGGRRPACRRRRRRRRVRSAPCPIGPPPKNGHSTMASAPEVASHLPLRVKLSDARLARIAGHAHVLPVGQPPAVQRVLLHGGDHALAVRADGDAGMAALPLQLARAVGFRGDEPQAGAVVVRGGDALAFRIEHQAGDAGGMVERLQFLPVAVEQVHLPADRAGQQARSWRRRSWRRARPISCRSRRYRPRPRPTRRNRPSSPPER